jgi:hypothetical protein
MMDDQKILANAPKCKSATFYAEFVQVRLNTYAKKWGGEYMFWDEKLSSWTHDGWEQSSSKANFRSLADIKEVVELRKANAELVMAITEQVKRRDELESENRELSDRMFELEKKIKSVDTILNIVKLNPMHDRATQVRRVFTAIEALKVGV